jgi:transposase
MNRDVLLALSKDELVALVLAQQAQIEALTAQVVALTAQLAELQARLNLPPKTPDNSGTPPSQGEKPNRSERRKQRRRGRPGVTRGLADNPDHVIEASLNTCPHCTHPVGAADQTGIHAYDHVDLPVIRAVITRINRHHGTCPCCHKRVAAPVPEGFEPGSPFGPGLCALIIHLHVTQAIGFERLARLLAEVFGMTISEGAIANILARAERPLVAAAAPIATAVRESAVVGSDETSARVGGKTWWQWVLLSSTAICHVIVPRRAATVIVDFLDGHRPEVWVSDRYAAQVGHGAVRQLCLAHLARDAQYAIDEGDAIFAPGFRFLLLRAMAIGRRRPGLKDSTLR